MTDRTILHLDMNAFFASVEQQSNPALKGKPIGIIGSGRTVVTTASYEARAFGVKTGMTVWQARQKCHQIILVQANNRKYTWVSSRIMTILREYTPMVEVFSIDEAFLDLTGSLALFGPAERIAYHLKSRIRQDFGLTCSIGIAPNKLLAKLASEMQKPDGLTIIPPENVARVMEHTPVQELCGIGAKLQAQLQLLGISTCGELGRYPLPILRRKFGVIGERLSQMGRGIDNAPVVPDEEAEEVKSVGHGSTFDQDISDRDELSQRLMMLCEMVGRRARRYRVAGRTVHLTVRYTDFTTFGRQQSRLVHTNSSEDIYREALAILDSFTLIQPVRLLAVRITNLCYQAEQLPIFPQDLKKQLAIGAMDRVNDRFGDFTLTPATLLDQPDKGAHVISPAWRPDGIRNVDVQ